MSKGVGNAGCEVCSPVMGGQGVGELAGGREFTHLVTSSHCYTVFKVFTVIVGLTDLGDVVVAHVSWMS